MNEKKIKFSVIRWKILEKLDLTVTEYLLLDTIFILSKKNGWCFASKEVLGEIIQIKRNHIDFLIKKLIKKDLLEKNKENKKQIRPTEKWYKESIKKPYYNGMRVIKEGNKLYCISPTGERLEFAGQKSEIIYK